MANFKYFSGDRELTSVRYMGGVPHGLPQGETAVFVQGVGFTGYVPADRTVQYKSNPSRHDCDARCFNATGRVMKCECSCGGKNHGRGAFMCEAA
jgi:hypothetical protein